MGPEQEQYKLQEVLDADALLIGRVTYESFAGAWPNYDGPFADKMNGMPKFVVSSTLREPAWANTVVLQGDAVEAVTALKQAGGGPILVAGSRTLVQALLTAGLVDRLRLMTFPVTIGGGLRVFPEARQKTTFTLQDGMTFPSGVTVQTFGITPA